MTSFFFSFYFFLLKDQIIYECFMRVNLYTSILGMFHEVLINETLGVFNLTIISKKGIMYVSLVFRW